jgi:hypothetical protein
MPHDPSVQFRDLTNAREQVKRLRTCLSALLLVSSTSLLATIEIPERQDINSIKQTQELEKFVTALGQLFASANVHDPDAVRATLNVTLSRLVTSTDAYSGYSVTNLPVQVASAKYITRRLAEGALLGDFYVEFRRDGICLSIEKLRDFTRLGFERRPIVWHSDDRKNSGVIDRYLVTKTDARAKQVILSARLSSSRCVTSIALVNR